MLMTTNLLVGVLLRSATLLIGTSTFASGKYVAVQPRGIAPAGLLGIKPGLTRIREHRLTRRTVQEDLGNGIGHASKLARCG